MYLAPSAGTKDSSSVISEIHRAWSARSDDDEGYRLVASRLDGTVLQKCSAAHFRTIAKVLDLFGLKSDDGSNFYESRSRKTNSSVKLLKIWAKYVKESTKDAFIGRYFHLDLAGRVSKFKE